MDIQTDSQQEQAISNGNPEPIVGNRGASILGPRNVPIERQNPDALIAPAPFSPISACTVRFP
jgi:hypothetical protein